MKLFLSMIITLFLGPGTGHIYLKEFKRGIIFLSIALLLALLFAAKLVSGMPPGTITSANSSQLIKDFISQHPRFMLYYDIFFAGLWSLAFLDTYNIFRKSKKKIQQVITNQMNNNPIPERYFTAEQMREIDRRALDEFGVPGIALMENAGRAVAEAANSMLAGTQREILIVCGGGNNGGDGFVAARHLFNHGHWIKLILLKHPNSLKGDARVNFEIINKMRLPIESNLRNKHENKEEQCRGFCGKKSEHRPAVYMSYCKIWIELFNRNTKFTGFDLIIDAMLGTGTKGTILAPYKSAIKKINQSNTPVLSIDIPSGLDANTGSPLGTAIKAAATITLAALKTAFQNPSSTQYTGRITKADIGIPIQLLQP